MKIIFFCILSLFLTNIWARDCHEPTLVKAISRMDLKRVTHLLKNGASPDTKTCHGFPVIHLAMERRSLDILKLLVAHNANVDATDARGNTALHYTAERDRLVEMVILLKAKANPNLVNSADSTPLMLATRDQFNSAETMELLLKYNANPKQETNHQYPSALATLLRYNEIIKATDTKLDLLLRSGANPDALYETGTKLTLLYYSIFSRNHKFVKALLKHKANPNFGHDEFIPVCAVVRMFGTERILEDLLIAGINFNVTCTGAPVLFGVLKSIDMTVQLLNGGADVNVRGEDGSTALMHATNEFYFEKDHWSNLAPILFNAGADIKAQDSSGRTALHHASLVGSTIIISDLIAHGADVNAFDEYGETPIFSAIYSFSNMKMLASKGAILDLENDFPLLFRVAALTPNNESVLRWLHANKVDFNRRWGISQLTVLEYAEAIDLPENTIELIRELSGMRIKN